MTKKEALTQYLTNTGKIKGNVELEKSEYDENLFECKKTGEEYLVLTDEEADERVKEYIEGSLWTFNASFLANFTELPQAIFEALQPQCEDSNEAILELIELKGGLDNFVNEAIKWDSRGHFISNYDGIEEEHGNYFIYRYN